MLKRLLRRFRDDEGERRAGTIREWAEEIPDVTLIKDVEPRSVAKVAGVVEVLRVRPREGVQAFEADITDGTGTVTAIWLGRPMVSGVSIGVRVMVEGRMGGEPKRLQVMNPTFNFAPGEVH